MPRKLGEKKYKHGHSIKGKETSEYRSWSALIKRCTNPSHERYCDYGGKGVLVCDRWRDSFANFLQDMGLKPSPAHTLDRFPQKEGNYEPGNCRWATTKEQNRNRKSNVYLEFEGERLVKVDWAKRLGI